MKMIQLNATFSLKSWDMFIYLYSNWKMKLNSYSWWGKQKMCYSTDFLYSEYTHDFICSTTILNTYYLPGIMCHVLHKITSSSCKYFNT